MDVAVTEKFPFTWQSFWRLSIRRCPLGYNDKEKEPVNALTELRVWGPGGAQMLNFLNEWMTNRARFQIPLLRFIPDPCASVRNRPDTWQGTFNARRLRNETAIHYYRGERATKKNDDAFPKCGPWRCQFGLGSHKSLPKGRYHAEETRAAGARRGLEPRGKPRRRQRLVSYAFLTLGRAASAAAPRPPTLSFSSRLLFPQDNGYLEEAAARG